jgi:uncharacterized protein YndB with AHSA1/START domain
MSGYSIVPVVRTIPAPPLEVFRAFVEPDLLLKWFAPTGCRCVEADIDPRVDGTHRTVVETPDGQRHMSVGRFIEFSPGRRLVMTWRYVGPDGPSDGVSVVSVDFEGSPPGGTTLTLHHDGLESDFQSAGVQEGWRQMFDGFDAARGFDSR